MAGGSKQMTEEEILQQLPDNMRQRKFSSVPIEGYTSVWEPQKSVPMMLWEKVKENPFVPVGLAGTVYFLTRGIINMGNSHLTQKMMRGRVAMQAFTLTALVIGVAIEGVKQERNKEEK